jgi:hypothetical protein
VFLSDGTVESSMVKQARGFFHGVGPIDWHRLSKAAPTPPVADEEADDSEESDES